MIEFECPACNTLASAPEDRVGQRYSCQGCGALLEIPASEGESGGFEAIGGPVEDAGSGGTIRLGQPNAQAPTVQVQDADIEKDGATIQVSKSQLRGSVPCSRCGNFMPADEVEPGQRPICIDCEDRAAGIFGGFPMDRDNWSFGEVFSYSWRVFQRDWIIYSLAAFLVHILQGGLNFVIQVIAPLGAVLGAPVLVITLIGAGLALMVVSIGLTLGLVRMFIDGLRGKRPDLATLFSQFGKAPKAMLQLLLIYLGFLGAMMPPAVILGVLQETGLPQEAVSGIAMVTLFPLMIFIGIPLMFCWFPELAYNDEAGILGGLRNCYTIASGHRLALLGAYILLVLIASVGMLACCVGVYVSGSYALLVGVTFYMALRNGSGLPPVRD